MEIMYNSIKKDKSEYIKSKIFNLDCIECFNPKNYI